MACVVSRGAGGAGLPRLLLIEDPGTLQREATALRPCMIGDAAGFEVPPVWGRPARERLKRAIDLSIALPLALLALPIIAILAGVIILVSPGSPFYRQQRVGHCGKTIQILKLRTMHADAESRLENYLELNPSARAEWERFYKLKHDPRILSFVGTFIRRTSLDELPQIWNILRGDMTLVGPRPFPAYHVRAFDPDFQALRASVKPGLTGLWQISFRSNGDLGIQKVQDSFYINNWSVWLDFYILLQTLPAVLRGEGAR
jgi:lipopolysaccharide/colanic/teichoic acid biosynthesis glycosyltransferase